MEPILRAVAIYAFLFLIFRIAGKRSVSEMTTFDFVLLLIIGESTQQALIGNDFSIVNAFILITTLVTIEVTLNLLKDRFPLVGKVLDDVPLIVLRDGVFLRQRMRSARVDENDILAAARQLHGLTTPVQIKYAIVEQNGEISIVPQSPAIPAKQ